MKPGIRSSSPILRVVRIVVALILLQTLWFKFTGALESIHIFERVGMEPFGRYASGVAELIAALLLFHPAPRFTVLGAGLALGVIVGAIFFHLTTLGIVVDDDGGLLFTLALAVFFGSALLLFALRAELRAWQRRLFPSRQTA